MLIFLRDLSAARSDFKRILILFPVFVFGVSAVPFAALSSLLVSPVPISLLIFLLRDSFSC